MRRKSLNRRSGAPEDGEANRPLAAPLGSHIAEDNPDVDVTFEIPNTVIVIAPFDAKVPCRIPPIEVFDGFQTFQKPHPTLMMMPIESGPAPAI